MVCKVQLSGNTGGAIDVARSVPIAIAVYTVRALLVAPSFHSRYVLLKERNMLLTLKHEARRAGFIMPAPERMWKVWSCNPAPKECCLRPSFVTHCTNGGAPKRA